MADNNITIQPPDEIVLNVTDGAELQLSVVAPDNINLSVNSNLVVNTVTIENTERILKRVWNNSGKTLGKGRVVYVTGGHGSSDLTIDYADKFSEATSSKSIGLIYEDIADNSQGYVITQGFLQGFNTTAYASEGSKLYLGTNGYLTDVEPDTPDHMVFCGWLVKKGGAGVGSVYVLIQNGFELEELHDVKITTPADGDALVYDSGLGYWKNGQIQGGKRSRPSFASTTGRYFTGMTSAIAPSSTSNFSTAHNNYLMLYPVTSYEDLEIVSMKMYIQTSNIALGLKMFLYGSDEATGRPIGTPLEESGSLVIGSAGIYTYILPFSRLIEGGKQYWVGLGVSCTISGGAIRGQSSVYWIPTWNDITTTLNYPLTRTPYTFGGSPVDFTATPWVPSNTTATSLGNAMPQIWMEIG